jgi:endonuclease V-like protein UPF0215 family
MKRYSNIIGFDDAPFPPDYRGNIKVVGAVFADLRFDGVILGEIEKDGFDAAEKLTELIVKSKFVDHVQLILLQGIAMGGFNVVDVFYLNRQLELPVLVVSRRRPNMEAVRRALITKIPDGGSKWAVIEKLGPMEPVGSVFVQRVGLTENEAVSVIERTSVHSQIPEPIRVAHMIAGVVVDGQSRGSP